MLDVDTFSTFLSVSVVLFFLFSLTIFLVDKFWQNLDLDYFFILKLIGFTSIFSTLSVLAYQFIYYTPVCDFCWWQRIFMFPIDAIILWAIYFKKKDIEFLTLLLSLGGGLIAAYHYYFHYQNIVLGNKIDMACSVVGLTPSCTESSILVFGFITIPLMAILAFSAISILSLILIFQKINSKK